METTTKSIKFNLLPLTNSKKERVQTQADYFKEVYNRTSILLPTVIKPSRKQIGKWRKNIMKDIPLYAQTIQEAMSLAMANRKTAIQETDDITILNKSVISYHNQSWSIERHNNRWYIKIPAEKNGRSYNKIWLPIKDSNYYDDIICMNYNYFGAGQYDIKSNTFITSMTTDINEIEYIPQTFIGIDRGWINPAVLVVIDKDKIVKEVKFFGGKEYIHIRKQYKNRRAQLQHNKQLKKVKEINNEEHRWMEYENHRISKQIIEIAKKYPNPIIIMENHLTAPNNIKSWTHASLRQKIEYKAGNTGIKVDYVDARYTSRTCNKCNHEEKDNRQTQNLFKCLKCGYTVHADLNAAINIAFLCA